MKKIVYLFALSIIAFSCSESAKEEKTSTQNNQEETQTPVNNVSYYGAKITEENAIPVTELSSKMEGKDSLQTKIKAKIIECCKKKGCWMSVDLGNGEKMRVTFKDYEFFVPKDGSADGKEVIFEGVVRKETTSVEDLKHFAEDGGKSKEEIEKITTPKEEYTFEASGVIIKN